MAFELRFQKVIEPIGSDIHKQQYWYFSGIPRIYIEDTQSIIRTACWSLDEMKDLAQRLQITKNNRELSQEIDDIAQNLEEEIENHARVQERRERKERSKQRLADKLDLSSIITGTRRSRAKVHDNTFLSFQRMLILRSGELQLRGICDG
jgi:hypothetical protein